MAETVGSHTIATFTSPVNGTTPIDANTVRGNDNVIQTAYNAHDTDTGIHVQSSALASRPAAGTAGRKWITVDGTVQRLWYDTGSVWLEVQAAALSTARTLWGQSFDGSANVSGSLSSVTDIGMSGTLTIGSDVALSRGAANRLDLATGDNLNLVNGAYLIGAASVLSATTLGSGVVNSSLTSVGTLTSGAIGSGFSPIANSALANSSVTVNGVSIALGASGTVAAAASTLTGSTLASGVTASSLTSVGTLTSLTVSGNTIVGAEVFRNTATSFMRLDGGSGIGSGANMILFGETHATAPGRVVITAVGTGVVQFNAGGATRATLDNSGNLAVDTNTLFVDAVNNCVGVGTSSPNAYGAFAVFSAGIGLHNNSTSGAAGLNLYEGGSGRFSLRTLNGSAGLSFFDSFNGVERARLDASGNLAVDTNVLYVDATNNRVGVGTTGPATNLHLLGVASANADFTHETVSAGTAARTRYLRNGSLKFLAGLGAYTGGDTYEIAGPSAAFATIDASGNLGLGVTPSPWISGATSLDIRSTSAFADVGGSTTIANNSYRNSGGGWVYKTTNFASRLETDSGAFRWLTAPSGTAGDPITFAQPMTLDANGNLLVGLTSTIGAAKAAVAGTILSSTNTLSTFSGAYGGFDWVSRSTRIFAGSADATNSQIEFYAGVSGAINERLRIKGPGQVRFIPLGAAPTTNVEDGDVYYDSGTNKLRVRAGGAWTDLH